MELTIKEALKTAVERHKVGKLKEAERLYRSILKTQPKHPDANHNLGVLAISLGKVREGLPFLRLALNTSPEQGQFWISYIDALIKIGQFENANEVLLKGKDSGLKGDKVDQLEAKLNSKTDLSSLSVRTINSPGKEQIDKLVGLHSEGKLNEALSQANIVADKFPDSHIIKNFIGVIYAQLNENKLALSVYKKAIMLNPNYARAYNNLGNSLNSLLEHDQAICIYKKAIECEPNYPIAHNNLGNALNETGDYQGAISVLKNAIRLKMDYAEAFTNLGGVFYKINQLDQAISVYKKALALKPNHAEAYNNLGTAFQKMGRYSIAITTVSKAIKLNPNFSEAYNNLANILCSVNAREFSEPLAKAYQDIINFPNIVQPEKIVGAILVLLKHHQTIKEAIVCSTENTLANFVSKFLIKLSDIELFTQIMEICPITDIEIEVLLMQIRKILLLERKKLLLNRGLLRFQCKLALQCFTNEYIYVETEEETASVELIEISIQKSLLKKEKPSQYEIACLASYRSLFTYQWAKEISPPEVLRPIFERQVFDVQRELALKEKICSLAAIKNEISLEVAKQYEENPYPRWIKTKLQIEPKNIKKFVAEMSLKVISEDIFLAQTPEVLVAGCGTGEHAVYTASKFRNSHVTAIDLSLTSLSYAKRKTEELGLTNIDFIQADILDISEMRREFDIIESIGVLHHMKEPLRGWRALVNSLKPSGLMRLGLYSELARGHVRKARTMIANEKSSPDKEAMKRFRQKIILLNDPTLNKLQQTVDFYSTSAVRDLLFHIQEHRFNIPQIRTTLDELGLAFVGFEFPTDLMPKAFEKMYPKKGDKYNLDNWHEHEKLNPELFVGMYQFWAQKL